MLIRLIHDLEFCNYIIHYGTDGVLYMLTHLPHFLTGFVVPWKTIILTLYNHIFRKKNIVDT
jgi:hypothetical protein